jgi:hypothetical protein
MDRVSRSAADSPTLANVMPQSGSKLKISPAFRNRNHHLRSLAAKAG